MAPMIHKILLLEDHRDAQAWLLHALQLAFGPDIHVDTVSLLAESKKYEQENSYDFILVDLNVPDGSGVDLIRQFKVAHPDRYCVVATIFSDKQHLFSALKAGADGYILKDEEREDIAQMLGGILQGNPPISASMAQQMLRYFHANFHDDHQQVIALSDREREVLTCIAQGMSNKACARELSISHHTVSEYIHNVYRKLGIHSRAEATREAIRRGII